MPDERTEPVASPSNRWRPTCSVDTIRARATLYREVRAFFDERGFLEVDPPVLSHDTVVDLYLDPIGVPLSQIGLPGDDRADRFGPAAATGPGGMAYLQTSPEFALKRLIAAGCEAIYTISHAFRAGESGPHHNTEFAMLEWYRVGDDLAAGVALLADLTEMLLRRGRPETITYDAAFETQAGVSGLTADAETYRVAASQLGVTVPASMTDDLDGWRNLLMGERIQPALGHDRPTIVTHYPASQAALAQLSTAHPGTAERFELFAGGVELANGYHELLDAETLRRRAVVANKGRIADGRAALPVENHLLAAMRASLPPCAGCAMGLDRVLMLRQGASKLADVIAFLWDRA